ncbi:unnamed protein product [Phyllotreta striolata]|uniref:Uncharacterized protein n=1 Tax=Phyllotreta striolata TaxID=444603 RepID=A0A9N9TA72_PHYSR|nr:unnamed protein product [Phyllotreta striolata]
MDLVSLDTSKPNKKTKRAKNRRIELHSDDETSTPEVRTRNTRARRKKTGSKENNKKKTKSPKTQNIDSYCDSEVANKENASENKTSNTKKRGSKRLKKQSKIDKDFSDASPTNCGPINSTLKVINSTFEVEENISQVENSTFEVENSIFDVSELPLASAKKPKNIVRKSSSKSPIKGKNISSTTKSSINKSKGMTIKDKSLRFSTSPDSISEAKKGTPKASETMSEIMVQDTNSSDPEATKYLQSRVTRRKHWDTSSSCSILNSSGLVMNLYPKKTDSSGNFSEKKEASGTNKKVKKETGTTGKKIKIPDFASIHKKRNEKIENIEEMLARKSARANRLLSGLKPESTASSHIPKIKKKLNFSPKKKLELAVKIREQLQRKSSPKKEMTADALPTKKRSLEKIRKVEGHLLKISKPPKTSGNIKFSLNKSNTKLKKKPSLDKAPKPEVRISKPLSSNSELQSSTRTTKSKIPLIIKAPAIPNIPTIKTTRNHNFKPDKMAVANKVRTRRSPKQDLNSKRQFLNYVRTNRRFDLLMEMRKIKN